MTKEAFPQSGIYRISNTVSGRIYVGSAVDLRQRWRSHLHKLRRGTHHSRIFQRSWDKHGEDAFVFEVLELVPDNLSLVVREQAWIDKLNACDPAHGFNLSPTAGSTLGFKLSPEQRAKKSAMSRGRKRAPFTPEHRARISETKRGTKASKETRAKMSAAHVGKKRAPRTQEHRTNISKGKKGRKFGNMPPRTRQHVDRIIAARRAQRYNIPGQLRLLF